MGDSVLELVCLGRVLCALNILGSGEQTFFRFLFHPPAVSQEGRGGEQEPKKASDPRKLLIIKMQVNIA